MMERYKKERGKIEKAYISFVQGHKNRVPSEILNH